MVIVKSKVRSWWGLALVVPLVVLFAACGGDDDGGDSATPEPEGGMVVASDSFQEGSGLPDVYTCVGDDQSPPVSWLEAPAEAVAFALIMDDPDAGGFVHWVIYDIPGDVRDLPIDLPDGEQLANGAKQGENGFGDVGYGGPCPPEGETHTYRFRVFALDAETGLEAGASAEDVEAAFEGHVLDQGQITTTAAR
jgi:Raf kinase inhibitor-like YbhB/YbcL family protein